MTTVTFAHSPFWPVALGFFGLGCGYLVWGGTALFEWPARTPDVDRTVGLWGVWMNGFMQFITGTYIMVGLTWFGVFQNAPPLYMAGLAFTAYGVHWFAIGHRRYVGASSLPDAFMSIAFFLLSALGATVFFSAGDVPVAILFVLLSLLYISEIPTNFQVLPSGHRLVGFWQFITGWWLMYLTWAAAMNFALGAHWWL